MKKYAGAFIISLFFSIYLFAQDKSKGALTLDYHHLKSDKGSVIVKLYDTTSEKFPKTEFAIAIKKATIKDNEASITFDNLPYGIYAYSTFHDENSNGMMDTNLIHIPAEGFAFSNNLKVIFGPPSFEKASFELKKDQLNIDIILNY